MLPINLEGVLIQTTSQLQGSSDSPRLDAEVLLAHVLNVSRAYLYTWPERRLEAAEAQRYQALIEQRAAGTPVAYLTGQQEFWSLTLEVSPATLVPRPETELLVEQALSKLPPDQACAVLDLGTGSGAIALAIASERPLAQVWAVDISHAALDVAKRNRQRLGLAVEFLHSDWYAAVSSQRFQIITANPPYIGANEPEAEQGDCRFEPRQALIAAESGLAELRQIIQGAPQQLEPGGWLLVEHGYRQGTPCRELFAAAGFTAIATHPDLQGHERLTLGQYQP